MKKVFYCLLSLFFIVFLSSCSCKKCNYDKIEKNGKDVYVIENQKYIVSNKETDFVKIDVNDKGIMIAQLYPKTAPITVSNYKKLVSEKFYDGVIFHRVIKDFMIQTGGYKQDGTYTEKETIKGEFSNNNVENNLSHTRGVLSMARLGANPDTEQTMNSASSQFFIVHKDSDYLDGNYAAFGKVIHGLEIIDSVATSTTDENDKPLNDIVINSITFVEKLED